MNEDIHSLAFHNSVFKGLAYQLKGIIKSAFYLGDTG
jgi:hypothetical protein